MHKFISNQFCLSPRSVDIIHPQKERAHHDFYVISRSFYQYIIIFKESGCHQGQFVTLINNFKYFKVKLNETIVIFHSTEIKFQNEN